VKVFLRIFHLFLTTYGRIKKPPPQAVLFNDPLLCEGFRARQGLAQHLPDNRKTTFAIDCITPLAGLHLQML